MARRLLLPGEADPRATLGWRALGFFELGLGAAWVAHLILPPGFVDRALPIAGGAAVLGFASDRLRRWNHNRKGN